MSAHEPAGRVETPAWVELDGFCHMLPYGWAKHDIRDDGAAYVNQGRKLAAILSVAVEDDGKRWAHLSVSHRDRIPTWEELVRVKEDFLGTHRKAVQVLPPRSEYVNICARCLHVFCCLDGDVLPDFTQGSGSL